MKCDPSKLGAGLLAATPLLMQFGNSKVTWWLGVLFAVAGPVLMSMKKGK